MPANPHQNQNQAGASNPAGANNAPTANAENPQQQPPAAPQDNQASSSNSATPAPESKDSGSAANPADKQDSQSADAEQARQQQTAKNVVPKRPSKSSSSDSTPATSGTSLEADGEKYLYGNGVPQDCNRARKSLLSASGQGDAKAQSVLGTMYATGHCAPRDLPLAYKWFAKALHAEPSNDRLSQDLKVLWNQMTPDERNLALKNQ
jgi:TPR repeat protein